MSCIGTKFLDTFTKLFGMKKRGKDKLEDISDYADYYWRFINNNLETSTTEQEDLPGFSDYHKMLKKFLKSQPIYDEVYNDVNEDQEDVYSQDKYSKVREWLEGVEERRGVEKFSDVHNFLDSQNCQHCKEEDTMHYACVDVTGMSSEVRRPTSEVNLSFESTGSSSWEVTKKPRSRLHSRSSRASNWI